MAPLTSGRKVPKVAESSATDEQLESFGRALVTALNAKGLTSGALLGLVAAKTDNGKRSVINRWMNGEAEPSRPKVIAIEQVLELEPGTLSRHLGWLPLDAANVPGVEASILADADLTPTQKNILLAALQDFRRS